MRSERRRDDDGRSGFALVAVLAFMLIVSAIVVPFALTARTRLMIANNEIEQERLTFLADGLANVVSAELLAGPPSSNLSVNAEPAQCRIGRMIVTLSVQDHAGLIDLNASSADLLSLGLVSLGFSRQPAEELAKSIIAFRSAPSAFATAPEPSAMGGPNQSKHAPFESVSELQEFPALAAVQLHDLQSIFTVNLKRGAITPAMAPKALRSLLHDREDANSHDQTNRNSAYTVEVRAGSDDSGVVGQVGFVIEPSPQSAVGFRRASLVPPARESAAMTSALTTGCETLLGNSVTDALRRWAS